MAHLSNKDQQVIVRYISEHVRAHTLILFGSAAKGTMRSDSDVDLAFLSDAAYSPYDLFMIAQGLADLLGREVDLIDFCQASPVFKAQIVSGGKLLLDQEPITRQYAYMRALKEYAMLNDERREILEKLGYGECVAGDKGHLAEQDRDHTSLRE